MDEQKLRDELAAERRYNDELEAEAVALRKETARLRKELAEVLAVIGLLSSKVDRAVDWLAEEAAAELRGEADDEWALPS